jgi:hypothetical protein
MIYRFIAPIRRRTAFFLLRLRLRRCGESIFTVTNLRDFARRQFTPFATRQIPDTHRPYLNAPEVDNWMPYCF